MDRRLFLKRLALTAGGIYVAERTFFLPPRDGWMTMSPNEDLHFTYRDYVAEIEEAVADAFTVPARFIEPWGRDTTVFLELRNGIPTRLNYSCDIEGDTWHVLQ